jgi:hypothetical protein
MRPFLFLSENKNINRIADIPLSSSDSTHHWHSQEGILSICLELDAKEKK